MHSFFVFFEFFLETIACCPKEEERYIHVHTYVRTYVCTRKGEREGQWEYTPNLLS